MGKEQRTVVAFDLHTYFIGQRTSGSSIWSGEGGPEIFPEILPT